MKKGECMKKFKIVILLSLLFILTGCRANYSVSINSDGKVTEKFVISIDTSSIEANDPKALIDNTIKTYKNNGMYTDYKIESNVGKKKSTITATRRYNSVSDYVNKSSLLPSLFEKTFYIDNNGEYGIETTGKYYYDAIYDTSIVDEPLFDTIDINIHSQLNITDSNAEKFDKNSNTLHWTIDKDKKIFSINFKYNNSKKYDIIIKDYLKNNWFSYLVIIIIITGVVAIVRFIKKQNKLNNKI